MWLAGLVSEASAYAILIKPLSLLLLSHLSSQARILLSSAWRPRRWALWDNSKGDDPNYTSLGSHSEADQVNRVRVATSGIAAAEDVYVDGVHNLSNGVCGSQLTRSRRQELVIGQYVFREKAAY